MIETLYQIVLYIFAVIGFGVVLISLLAVIAAEGEK